MTHHRHVDHAKDAVGQTQRQVAGVVAAADLVSDDARARDRGSQSRANRGDLAEIPVHQVNHVRTQVPDDAVGTAGVEPPLIGVIPRKAGDERELRPVDVAEYPILDQRFEVLVMRLPTPREQHHMFDPAPLRRLQHAPRVGSIVSKRLFAENVQALIDCRERHSKVLVVRRRYDDRVEATICDELPVVGECCGDAVFGRHLCESGGITSGDGGNLYVGAIAEVRQIHEFHPVAGPDNAQPNTVSHVSPWTVAGAVHLPKRGSQTGGPSCRNTIHSHRSQRTAPTTVDAPQWTPEETWQHVRACRSGASGLAPRGSIRDRACQPTPWTKNAVPADPVYRPESVRGAGSRRGSRIKP